MAVEITQLLLSAQSADAKIRTEAESNLREFQEKNLSPFLLSLSSCILAGIVLQNSLDSKDVARKGHLIQKWLAVDKSIKSKIKELLLSTLGSSAPQARHTSAQDIAKVASIEVPCKEWPELVGALLLNMTQQDFPASLKQATLESLGYVCQEITHQNLVQDKVNSVLTAVVQGMNTTEYGPQVCLAATRALYNALDFAQTNFKNKTERNYIIKVVCETTLAKEVEIRQAAFECLVSIATTYYELPELYMHIIFELTSKAVKGDERAVALQTIEFWSSICDEELTFKDYEVAKSGNSCFLHSNFIEKSLPSLVPMLLETLLRQEEEQDQDDSTWNVSMAGGTCLGLVARIAGDSVVPLVMPFVETNILKTDWQFHEAATYAFGSILEGPSVEKLALVDSHMKDTTAWTLSRILELLHAPSIGFSVISPANLQQVVGVLLDSITDAPRVVEKGCGAIYYLAQGYKDAGTSLSLLSPYLPSIIICLITSTDRTDGSDFKLMSSAYETLNEVVRVSSDDREKQGNLQALLCGALHVVIQKLGSTDGTKLVIMEAADQIMILFLKVLACRRSTVHEETMLALGALAYAAGPAFGKHMSEFYKYLEMDLQNFEECQVCAISVGVVGDVCRALNEKVLPYCDGIMTYLLKDLSSNELNRSVKPPIFSCFGDIALSIGEHFEKYLPYAIPMMQGAAEISYSGILQGCKNFKPDLMLPYAVHLLRFVELVCADPQREENVTKAAVAVLGILADALGSNVKILLKDRTFCAEFWLNAFKQSTAQRDRNMDPRDAWPSVFRLWMRS
ncbi:hypothetical protein NMG60_11035999 [Bertholletia excelsa]